MVVVQDAHLNAIPFFAVDRISFATDVVAYTGRGHEIPLIRGINRHSAVVGMARQGGSRYDLASVLYNARLAVQPFVPVYIDLVFSYIAFKDVFGDMGFENPHGSRVAVNGGRALAFVSVSFFPFPFPSARILVMQVHPVVKIAR